MSGTSSGVGRAVMDEARTAAKEWGFDLTGFASKAAAQKAWSSMGLPPKPKATWGTKPYMHYLWEKPGLQVVCTNNPFEGEEKIQTQLGPMRGKAGYCGYVGIRGEPKEVKKAVAAFRKGDYKDQSPGRLDFANFADYDEPDPTAERKKLLEKVWKNTHPDYRGKAGGKKAVLVLRKGNHVMVALDDLTDDEIKSRT